jgi:hypothetical protein
MYENFWRDGLACGIGDGSDAKWWAAFGSPVNGYRVVHGRLGENESARRAFGVQLGNTEPRDGLGRLRGLPGDGDRNWNSIWITG